MERLKKYTCFLLSFSIIMMFPLSSFAAETAPALSVADYAFSTILNACGIDTSIAGVSSMLGQWDSYVDYQEKGKRGELGAYSQWLYNMGNTARAEEARQKYLGQQQALTRLQTAHWGDKVNIADTYAITKEWLSTFPSYHTDDKVYKNTALIPPRYADIVKPSGAGEYVFSSGDPSISTEQQANYYLANVKLSPLNLVALRGDYNSNFNKYYVNIYYVTSSTKYDFVTLTQSWRIMSHAGKLFTGEQDLTMRNMLYASSDIARFPFPVFSSQQAMESYISSGAMGTVVNSSVIGLPIQSVRPAVQNATVATIPSTLSLPTTIDLAQQLLDQIRAANDAALKSTLGNAGFVIDWTLDDVEEETTAASGESEKVISGKLSDILAKVEAIPAAIDTFFNNKMESEQTTEENTKRLSLPSSIAKKFPFCIPFDLAYLVTSLQATSEVPRFELPIKFDYLSFHYDETFVVDMAQWNTAVQILRIMLDVLFVAGLIAATRSLIRG